MQILDRWTCGQRERTTSEKEKGGLLLFPQVRSPHTCHLQGNMSRKKSPAIPYGPPETFETLRGSTLLSYLLLHQFATEKETQDLIQSLRNRVLVVRQLLFSFDIVVHPHHRVV